MKTKLQNLFFLLSLVGLAGCGAGGQSNASLQVSRAFAMTNPNFGGGLIITGKNLTTGKSFSKGLTTTMSFRISLDKGAWLISATGWDGGSASNVPFGGTPYCGKVQQTLVGDTESVDLNVSAEECASTFFAGSHVDTISTPNSVKKLGLINTCNTFFDGAIAPTDQISTKIVAAGPGSDSFCESVAPDLKTDVESVKIFAIDKTLVTEVLSFGFSSGCIKAGTAKSIINPASVSVPSNPYQSGTDLRIPVGGTPFAIITYKDNSCTDQVAVFPFRNGLGSGDPTKFDSLLYTHNSNDLKLILPANDLRRGLSPLAALAPYFEMYNAGSQARFATHPSSLGTAQFHSLLTTGNKAVVEGQNTCTSIGSGTYVNGASCSVVDGKAVVTYEGTTEGLGDFMLNGTTYYTYVDNMTFGKNRFESQKLSMEILGHDGDDSINNFFNLDKHDDKKYGFLSRAREMFLPNGAGGVIGVTNTSDTFATACLNQTSDKTISIFNFEKNALETYRVILENSVTSSPSKFTCDNTNLDPSTCSSSYDKRMMIFDYKVSAVAPMMVFEFNCTDLMGRMERNELEIKGAQKFENREIISWNTSPNSNLSYQRFEFLTWSKEFLYSSGWNQIGDFRSMARVKKTDSDNYEIYSYKFNSRKNGANYDQMLDYKRLKTSGTTNLQYISDGVFASNASLNYVLTNSSFNSQLDRVPASENTDNMFDPNSSFPQGPSGTQLTLTSLTSDFTNADKINDTLPLKLRSLEGTGFTNSFGTSFMTSP